MLKREVPAGAGGRARAWVNGSPVTASLLAEIGRALVNVHGQHEAQALLSPEAQRDILDAFGGAGRERDVLREAHRALVEAETACAALAAGQHLVVRRSTAPVRLVQLDGHPFFARLRMKLGWGGLAERDG